MNAKRKGTAREHASKRLLEAFKTPANCRKLVHVWKDREARPRVVELS